MLYIRLVRFPFTSLQQEAAGDLFVPIDFGILPTSDNVKRSMNLFFICAVYSFEAPMMRVTVFQPSISLLLYPVLWLAQLRRSPSETGLRFIPCNFMGHSSTHRRKRLWYTQ